MSTHIQNIHFTALCTLNIVHRCPVQEVFLSKNNTMFFCYLSEGLKGFRGFKIMKIRNEIKKLKTIALYCVALA